MCYYCKKCVNQGADCYKIYYHDTRLLIASLDEEAQEDLRANKNFGTYKGAIYENVVGEMLRKFHFLYTSLIAKRGTDSVCRTTDLSPHCC